MNTNNKEHSFSHLGEYPYSFDGYEYKSFKAVPEAPTQPGTCCDHCGTGINHVFWFVSADGNRFKVGSSCVEKSGDSGLKNQIKTEVKRIQKEQRAARKEVKNLAKRLARRVANWGSVRARLRSNPDLSRLLRVDNRITADVRTRFLEWGTLSDAQEELLYKLEKQNEAYKARKQADEERTWIPVPDGERLQVEGTVLSTKLQDTMYGEILKMLVRVDTEEGSFKLWGSVPQALWYREYRDGSIEHTDIKGKRVRFTAKLKRSDKDPEFGFFSRPTKAELVKEGE